MIVGTIKLFTIALQPASVFYRGRTTLLCYFTTANFEIETLQPICVCSRSSCCRRWTRRTWFRGRIIDRRDSRCGRTFRAYRGRSLLRFACGCGALLTCITLVLPVNQACGSDYHRCCNDAEPDALSAAPPSLAHKTLLLSRAGSSLLLWGTRSSITGLSHGGIAPCTWWNYCQERVAEPD